MKIYEYIKVSEDNFLQNLIYLQTLNVLSFLTFNAYEFF